MSSNKLINHKSKIENFKEKTLFAELNVEQQVFVQVVAEELVLSFQEFRQLIEACRDLYMWNEIPLEKWWEHQFVETKHALSILPELPGQSAQQKQILKKSMFKKLREHMTALKKGEKKYGKAFVAVKPPRASSKVVAKKTDKNIMGMCPVASEKTVCCNLRTIDAVENCAFGCSYCSVQTFYSKEFVFDENFEEKLMAIEIEPERFYHIGTGQASDSLLWGNRNGNLDSLCKFALKYPNVLLELKTKSDNISYFLDNDIPKNIVLSWSINTQTVIENEEHFTASLDKRIRAARQVANEGVKVAFHFHPMVYYQGWEEEYPAIAKRLIDEFDQSEVLFISFGTVTLIKPVMKNVRKLGYSTKILQMDLVPDPHGKLTYPDEIKRKLFKNQYEAFAPWHDEVFFYMCMEKADIWKGIIEQNYANNEEFEKDFGNKTMAKINHR